VNEETLAHWGLLCQKKEKEKKIDGGIVCMLFYDAVSTAAVI